ncbi:hypothetical protein L6272_05110 [Microgenomates group bacterium]|nr:hypothetical protein [Microgenomates group bacterium]
MINLPSLLRVKNLLVFVVAFFLLLFLPFQNNVIAKNFTIDPSDSLSLISAINEANSNNEADVINIATNSSYLLSKTDNLIYSNTGLPVIKSDIIINGNGAKIYRENSSEKFRIFAIQSLGKLTLNDITISGGFSDDSNIGGGGILNFDGVLIINNSLISNNTALIGGGAGIWAGNESSTSIFKTTISDNNGGGPGGTLSISSGGAFVKRGSGLFEVTDSIFSNNYAETIGGAIYSNSTGKIVLKNTKITNSSTRNGGGCDL